MERRKRSRRSRTPIAGHLVFVFLVGTLGACGAGETRTAEITPQQLLTVVANGGSPLILDVRSPAEYAAGHVPKARNVPHSEITARLAEIALYRDRDVILYCERGGRASRARDVLETAGFGKLRRLAGDMEAWRDAGLPVEVVR
jgi:phage shock protein E